MQFNVLMVCTGNICRSVMAQQLLYEAVYDQDLDHLIGVDSCGISSEEYGNPPDRRARMVLMENNHDVPDHRARQILPDDFDKFQLILAMTSGHYNALQRLLKRRGINSGTGIIEGGSDDTVVKMYREFDPQLIGNLDQVADMDAALAEGERLRNENPSYLDVPDPWYGDYSDFVETLAVCERVTPNIVAYLRQQIGQ